MMFAVPLLNFIESICDRKSRAFTVLKYMFILNFLIQVLLYLTGISDFVRLLTVTHLLIGAAIVSMMVYSVREMKRNKSGYIKGIMGAQVILVVEVISGLKPGDKVVVSDMSSYKNKNKLKLK